MSPKIGKNDEARERSRAALLQAGADLMVEQASRDPFASLRLRAICERAGYSTGAFYLHWRNVDEYYASLADHLAADDSFNTEFAMLEEVAENNADANILTAITRVADSDFQLLLDSTIWDAMELLNLTWGRTRFRAEAASGYRTIDHSTGQAYGGFLAKRGREPRPPFDWDRVGVVLQGVIEGFGIRYKVDPDAVPQSTDSDPGLYATTVAALLAVLTRPVGDSTGLNEKLNDLLA
jgi:AcrR family transcriptional regulator